MKVKNLLILIICTICVAISANYGVSAEASADVVPVAADGVEEAGPEAGKIDLNRADAAMLTALPGIGPKTAQKITDYREANGPFSSVEELLNVTGIGPAKLEKIRLLVTVS